MGIYLNPQNTLFQNMVNSKIFVDHSLLIHNTNQIINTENNKLCVSRPRRFGKSTDANMLVAYYSKGCDSRKIFDNLKISQTDMYEKHLNKHHVIHLNMQNILTRNIKDFMDYVTRKVTKELSKVYVLDNYERIELVEVFEDIYGETEDRFIFIIDEWDCIFREYKEDKQSQERYLDFLRDLLKDKPYVELAYMTGILPIKKYGTHSALNMFDEISMIESELMIEFMGFTENEVRELCIEHDIDFDEMKQWYDGYHLSKDISTFSPRSVVASISRKKFGNYWTNTETYEALQVYIDLNFDGLKDDVVRLLAGESVNINVEKFQNDMTTFKSKDDIFTLLIHLGYLGYDRYNKSCYIPNKEVASAFVNSIEDSQWNETTKALIHSKNLLDATVSMKEEEVSRYIKESHYSTDLLHYNNEVALEYTLKLAYYRAIDYYKIDNQVVSGKGIADMVFIPRDGVDKPAMIIELKCNENPESAIKQIKEKEYFGKLKAYEDNLLLVGISYDKDNKEHFCKIEKYRK